MEISLKSKLEESGFSMSTFSVGMIEAFRVGMEGLAVATQNKWISLAQNRLGSSKVDYVNGLRHGYSVKKGAGGDVSFEIELLGEMANNVEFGMPSFDMKAVRPGWLGGGKAKTSAEGKKYITIPFRHSTAQNNMQYSGKAKAAGLDKQLKQVVKDYGLNKMKRNPSGSVVAGPVKRVPNKAPVHPYLRGLTRIQNPVAGTTASGKGRGQAQLKTWRVMSENSPAGSWVHPGIKAANLMPEAFAYAQTQIDRMMKSILGVP